ncbi:MAG: preprotein translocase subunit YajC [Miltoncostaeaceae bacterium]
MSGLIIALYIAIFIGLVYFIGVRPMRRRRRELTAISDRLQPGDDVLTVAGIYGTVTEIEDGETVLLEIAEDLDIRIAKSAISTILTDHGATGSDFADDDTS